MKLFLIDEDFRDFSGHHASYDMPICLELKNFGVEVYILGDCQAQLPDKSFVDFLPTFTKAKLAKALVSKKIPSFLARVFTIILGNICTFIDFAIKVTPRVKSNDILLICRPNSQTHLAYSLWSIFLSLRNIQLVQIYIFHNSPHALFLYQSLLLNLCGKNQKIFYIAHTEPLVNLCEKLTKKKCYLLPLPFSTNNPENQTIQIYEKRIISFAYLGLAHHNKGFDTLIETIDDLEDILSKGSIEFVIQCYTAPGSKSSIKLIQDLIVCANSTNGIRLIKTPMTPQEYVKVMNEADVILIPHRTEVYKLALSGVFTEALALGKPVIVSEETYMAEQMKLYGAGVTFQNGNSQSLANAIRMASQNIEKLKEQALVGKSRWLEIHNPNQFVEQLLEASKSEY